MKTTRKVNFRNLKELPKLIIYYLYILVIYSSKMKNTIKLSSNPLYKLSRFISAIDCFRLNLTVQMKREHDGPKLRAALVDTGLLHKFPYGGRRASSDNQRSSEKPLQFLIVSIVSSYFVFRFSFLFLSSQFKDLGFQNARFYLLFCWIGNSYFMFCWLGSAGSIRIWNMSPSLDLPPKGGFSFDLCRRNAMLESKGLKAPTFLKTGTTIVGLVFQVWNHSLFCLVLCYCYDAFLHRYVLFVFLGLLVLWKGLFSLFSLLLYLLWLYKLRLRVCFYRFTGPGCEIIVLGYMDDFRWLV